MLVSLRCCFAALSDSLFGNQKPALAQDTEVRAPGWCRSGLKDVQGWNAIKKGQPEVVIFPVSCIVFFSHQSDSLELFRYVALSAKKINARERSNWC